MLQGTCILLIKYTGFIGVQSEKQSEWSFTLCDRARRKSAIQLNTDGLISIRCNFWQRMLWSIKSNAFPIICKQRWYGFAPHIQFLSNNELRILEAM